MTFNLKTAGLRARASELGALSFHNQGDSYSAVGLGGLAADIMGFAGGVPVILADKMVRARGSFEHLCSTLG